MRRRETFKSRRLAMPLLACTLAMALVISIAATCRADGQTGGVSQAVPSAVPAQDSFDNKPIQRTGQAAASVTPSPLPQPGFDMDSGRVALALIGVVALIFFLRHLGKSILPGSMIPGRGGTVKVLSRSPLAPKQQVVLIQVGRRIVVAADCNSQLSSLCQITDADEVAALLGELRREKAAPISTPFTSWFKTAAEAFRGHDPLKGSDGMKEDALPADVDEGELERAEPERAAANRIEFEGGETERAESDRVGGRGENLDIYSTEGIPALEGGNDIPALTRRVRELKRQLGGPSQTA